MIFLDLSDERKLKPNGKGALDERGFELSRGGFTGFYSAEGHQYHRVIFEDSRL